MPAASGAGRRTSANAALPGLPPTQPHQGAFPPPAHSSAHPAAHPPPSSAAAGTSAQRVVAAAAPPPTATTAAATQWSSAPGAMQHAGAARVAASPANGPHSVSAPGNLDHHSTSSASGGGYSGGGGGYAYASGGGGGAAATQPRPPSLGRLTTLLLSGQKAWNEKARVPLLPYRLARCSAACAADARAPLCESGLCLRRAVSGRERNERRHLRVLEGTP